MKAVRILSMFVFAIFLLSFASAVSVYGTWGNQDEQITSRTISQGQTTTFVAEAFSTYSSANVNLKIYDSQDEEVYTFVDTSISKGQLFSGEFAVTPQIYQNAGSYIVVIEASDSYSTQSTILSLSVNGIADTTAPTITLLGSNPVTITQGGTYTDAGATANDNVDGDLTSEIVVTGLPINTGSVGTYTITYTVSDTAGNVATRTRTVNVVAQEDTIAPTITLLGSNPVNLNIGQTYTEYGATANDNVDGDITGSIVITNPVNIYVEGTYTVRYNVQDSSGNSAEEVTRTVIVSSSVTDTTAPVITLLGSNPQVIALGTAYTELGATANDNVDGDLTSEIVIDASQVNTNAVGNYIVIYTVSDTAGNTDTETRTVSVVDPNDTTAPTITIVTPEDNEEYNNEDLLFEVEINEVAEVRFSLDGGSEIEMEFAGSSSGILTFIYDVLNLDEGNHEVTFYATDAAGNTASETVEFSIDTKTSKKKDSTRNYVNIHETTSEEQDYLNQFKSKEIIYLGLDESKSNEKGWLQRFIDWLVNLFN